MDKLTEKINAMAISPKTKTRLIKIAELEHLQIQQVCRRLLIIGMDAYEADLKSKKEIL